MAWVSFNITVVHKNWTWIYNISATSDTFQDLLDCVQTWMISSVGKVSWDDWTWDEIWFSLTEWWDAVDLSASINTTVGWSDTTVYALYSEPETITGFYLDWTEYKFETENWWVTSVNWQTWAVTVDEFDPDNAGSAWQILTKTANGYEWANNAAAGKVKVWDLSTAPGQSTMAAITLWVAQWDDYSAILNVWDQTYIYGYSDSESWTTNYYFHWLRETTETTTTVNGQFTTLSNPAYKISVTSGTYSWTVIYTHTIWNFLTVEDSDYTTPYIPTADYQPATKKYVDDAVSWWWGWGWGWITNNTTWTTSTLSNIWVGTESEYSSLSSKSTSTLYFTF